MAPTLGLAFTLAAATWPGAVPAADGRRDDPVDAQLLLDLDVLRDPELAQRRPLLDRLRLVESLQLLERLGLFEAQTRTGPPKPKEAR